MLHLAGGGRDELRRLLEAGELRPAAALPLTGRPGAAPDPAGSRGGIDRAWPVPAPLAGLLPAGVLHRGSVVPVLGSMSLLWAMISAASRTGAWVALVGMPAAGILAAAEHGIAVDRLALIPDPGPDWPTVVAALLDGVDLVALQPPGEVTPMVGRRLAARARQRSAVLLPTSQWQGTQITLRASDAQWYGLGQGRGRMRCRQLTVTAVGRGRLALPRRVRVWLPAPDGRAIAPAVTVAAAAAVHLSRAA